MHELKSRQSSAFSIVRARREEAQVIFGGREGLEFFVVRLLIDSTLVNLIS
jgi:hypothetical protein